MLWWIAECPSCPLWPASLVKRFTTHVERDEWRRQHMAETGHWVTAHTFTTDDRTEDPDEG